MGEEQTRADGLEWYVAHVRPRCEKKLVEHGKIYNFPTTLPTYKSIKKYRGKEVSFDKPLFPGYVFLRLNHETRKVAIQSKYVANMLNVIDQQEFEDQLEDILFALEQEVESCPAKRLVGLKLQGRAIARHDYPVLHNGETVGIVTSGTWSPTLEEAIALAYVPPSLAKLGTELSVEIRGKAQPATVVRKPFYKRA